MGFEKLSAFEKVWYRVNDSTNVKLKYTKLTMEVRKILEFDSAVVFRRYHMKVKLAKKKDSLTFSFETGTGQYREDWQAIMVLYLTSIRISG